MEMATQEMAGALPAASDVDDILAWVRDIKGRAQRLVVCYLIGLFEAHDNGGHHLGGNGAGNETLAELHRIEFDVEQDSFVAAIKTLDDPVERRHMLGALHDIRREFRYVCGAPNRVN